jgi:hypothetical protein
MKRLVILGFILFLGSMALPVLPRSSGEGIAFNSMYGWQCCLMAVTMLFQDGPGSGDSLGFTLACILGAVTNLLTCICLMPLASAIAGWVALLLLVLVLVDLPILFVVLDNHWFFLSTLAWSAGMALIAIGRMGTAWRRPWASPPEGAEA